MFEGIASTAHTLTHTLSWSSDKTGGRTPQTMGDRWTL